MSASESPLPTSRILSRSGLRLKPCRRSASPWVQDKKKAPVAHPKPFDPNATPSRDILHVLRHMKIKAFDKKGPHDSKFSVKYKDDPNWWTHSLLREGYGKDKHWVLLGLPSSVCLLLQYLLQS